LLGPFNFFMLRVFIILQDRWYDAEV
jgi:hypothetical protein